MANRHVLTVEEQIRGVRKALSSSRTPPQLREALRERMRVLQARLDRERTPKRRARPKRAPGLLDWLGL